MNSLDFFTPRPYASQADLKAMYEVLRTGTQADTACYYIHPGDLSWWLFYPPIGYDLFQHTFMWDEPAQPGRLLGWMMVDPTWPSFEIFLQPELAGSPLAAQMFIHAEEQAYARRTTSLDQPMHKLWVAEGDAFQRKHLENRGFAPVSWDSAFTCNLSVPQPAAFTPDGFSLRRCRGLPEVANRAAAQYGAFGGTAPMEQYLKRFSRFMASPAYAEALDMVAVAPDGRIAAFCIAWLDPITRTGHFEPVGTHPDFQRKGLGKAVLQETLLRLRKLGIRQASVCTPERNTAAVALYQSVGFEVKRRLGLYEKK